jgi:hypothetical protein
MPPEIINLAIFGVEEAIKLAPGLATEFQTLFSSGNPTPADFAALRSKIAAESYELFVPSSVLPPDANDISANKITPPIPPPAPVNPPLTPAPDANEAISPIVTNFPATGTLTAWTH